MDRSRVQNWLSWFVPGLALLFLSGCPYSSDLPLSDPTTASLDHALLGTWKTQDKETGEWNAFTFLPFNKSEIVAFSGGVVAGDREAYRVFVTAVDAERFLNLRQLDATEEQQWCFARYSIQGDRMAIRLVDDTLFDATIFDTPAALQDFVRRHLADPLLYGADEAERQEMVWYRTN